MTGSDYNLQILKKSEEGVKEYAETLIRLVKEMDKKPVKTLVKNILNQYHIDNYYIQKKRKRIGVVKIFQGIFYYLGVEDDIDPDEYPAIISKVEEYLGGWRISRMEAHVHSQFVPAMEGCGYTTDYSRIKMSLRLKDARNLDVDESFISRTYGQRDLQAVIDMASDAYRESIDEKVGVFTGGMASSEIPTIMQGRYGEFRPDLTPVYIADGDHYIEGVCMTTIAEDYPFIVLIGVRRAQQGKGIGRKLLSWVIKKIKDEGFEELRLWVTSGNTRAENLYKDMGFRTICEMSYMSKQI